MIVNLKEVDWVKQVETEKALALKHDNEHSSYDNTIHRLDHAWLDEYDETHQDGILSNNEVEELLDGRKGGAKN